MRYASRLVMCLIAAALALAGPTAASAVQSLPGTGSTVEQKQTTQQIEIGPYVFTVPAGWLAWTYDGDATERENEQVLIALVEQIDPTLVEGATAVVEDNVPDMIAAAFAPDVPGEDLVYISLMSFGLEASLEGLGLTTQATPDDVIAALGFSKIEQANALTAGFQLEEDTNGGSYTGSYVLPDVDRIIVMAGGADALGWEQYGDDIQDAIRSFELGDDAADAAAEAGEGIGDQDQATNTPEDTSTGDLLTDQFDSSQLQVLTPADPTYLYPYEFPGQFMTGAVDLTQQPIDPILEKIEGTEIIPPVVGYVTAEPTFAFIGQPGTTATVGVVFAGDNYVDTVLLVHCPNGQWNFADDVKWANADPAISANFAQEGVYEVWIGSKQPNQMISGTLYVLVQ